MQTVNFSYQDGGLFLGMDLMAGFPAWEEWLTDNVAFLTLKEPSNKNFSGIFTSFATGNQLLQAPIASDVLNKLNEIKFYCLFPEHIGENYLWDGMMIKNEPIDISGKICEGITHALNGDFENAILSYCEALKVNPKLTRVNNLRGLCFRFMERYEEAEKSYDMEINVSPTSPDPYANLGIMYKRTGNLKLARTMFERALERDSFHLNSLLHLGRLLLDTDEKSRMLSSVNFRLSALYSEITAVQEHLLSSSQKHELAIIDYIHKIRAESGLLSDPELLKFLRKLELFRLNGAFFASLRGLSHILINNSSNAVMKNFLINFSAKRIISIERNMPDHFKSRFSELRMNLFKDYPELSGPLKDPSAEFSFSLSRPEGQLTPAEFVEIFLEEIIRDGKISNSEKKVIIRLKNTFGLEERMIDTIMEKIRANSSRNALSETICDLNPTKLYDRLVAAVSRDGKTEASEERLLKLASEILGLS
ncbi:MAG: hypothetical protein HQM10_24625 [Candidatus Riflebacteria bacterium]|nr:hypothetical protein [Candidatus Riflebacteria bacterium]